MEDDFSLTPIFKSNLEGLKKEVENLESLEKEILRYRARRHCTSYQRPACYCFRGYFHATLYLDTFARIFQKKRDSRT